MYEEEPEPPAAAIRFGRHIRSIAEAGSVHPAGASFVSPIQCIRRPNRKPCKGRIGITPMFDEIHWQCTDCETGGTITGWRNTNDDLSEFLPTKEQRSLVFSVSDDEYPAMKEVTWHLPEEASILASAVWADNEVVISGPFEAMSYFTDSLATEFNRSNDRKKRNLLWQVCMRLDELKSQHP